MAHIRLNISDARTIKTSFGTMGQKSWMQLSNGAKVKVYQLVVQTVSRWFQMIQNSTNLRIVLHSQIFEFLFCPSNETKAFKTI